MYEAHPLDMFSTISDHPSRRRRKMRRHFCIKRDKPRLLLDGRMGLRWSRMVLWITCFTETNQLSVMITRYDTSPLQVSRALQTVSSHQHSTAAWWSLSLLTRGTATRRRCSKCRRSKSTGPSDSVRLRIATSLIVQHTSARFSHAAVLTSATKKSCSIAPTACSQFNASLKLPQLFSCVDYAILFQY